MKRRTTTIALLALSVAPLYCLAQVQSRIWRIGFLNANSRQTMMETGRNEAFLQELRKLGYVEGKNLVIEWRFAEEKYALLSEMAVELAGLKLDVIVAAPSPAIRAMQKASASIPIVMASTGDPVGSGFVASLARPGGNITGLSNESGDISAKYLELLKSLVPKLSRVAVFGNPGSLTYGSILKNVRMAAQRLEVTVMQVNISTRDDLLPAFNSMAREGAKALIAVPDAFVIGQGRQIAELASRFRIPAIYGARGTVEAGGLMSYATSLTETYRRAAIYVDRILKGARPGDIPVEQPTKFELVINRRTAKELGLVIPQELLLRADEVID